MLRSATPVIHVADAVAAEAFYCQQLGFKVVASWRADPKLANPAYLTVERDAVRLHLTSFKDGTVGTWTSNVYVFVDDVDAIYSELATAEVTSRPPIDQSWGTREIGIRDADRNVITFGQRIGRGTSG